jgi:hypothetical protein
MMGLLANFCAGVPRMAGSPTPTHNAGDAEKAAA